MATFRLPAPLKAEATAYAQALGISLNALCAVALRDYLDARSKGRSGSAVSKSDQTALRAAPAARGGVEPVLRDVYPKPDAGVNAPCPCGSGQKWKRCHGKA